MIEKEKRSRLKITFEIRKQIEELCKLRYSGGGIARTLNMSVNTVSYELRKGGGREFYSAVLADKKTKDAFEAKKVIISKSQKARWIPKEGHLPYRQEIEIIKMQLQTILEILQEKING